MSRCHESSGSNAKEKAHAVGASKNSVPLMMTRCAGVFTPHASVDVATRICTHAYVSCFQPELQLAWELKAMWFTKQSRVPLVMTR